MTLHATAMRRCMRTIARRGLRLSKAMPAGKHQQAGGAIIVRQMV